MHDHGNCSMSSGSMSTPPTESGDQAVVAYSGTGSVPQIDHMEEEEDDFDESVHYHEFADPIFVFGEEGGGAGGDEAGEDGAGGGEGGEDGAEEEEDNVEVASKRKLTSTVWAEFKRVKVAGKWKAKCVYCNKELGGEPNNGTKHIHYHLGICVLKKIKTKGKTLSQSS